MPESNYIAKVPDSNGYIDYTHEEHKVWATLYNRQIEIIKPRACAEYLSGVAKLEMSPHKILQPVEITRRLLDITGFSVKPVPALISFKEFFSLLSKRVFPAASFIRTPEDLDYLKEPDIFHEIFGHCPLLTDPNFAAFTEEIGKFGLTLAKDDRIMLARLYWFTVEFGLIRTAGNVIKIYGAGILSSKTESIYALESAAPIRREFDLIHILRMPYRYDELQKVYYIINSFEEVYNMINGKLLDAFKEARSLGMLDEKGGVHNEEGFHAC